MSKVYSNATAALAGLLHDNMTIATGGFGLRAGGAGIPGFYTRTGCGTKLTEGKETKVFDDKEYVLEPGITAEVSLVKAWKGDKSGNLIFRKTSRNFNPMIASCGKVCVAEVEQLVEIGELDPDQIHTPGIFVDRIIQGEKYEKRIEFRTVQGSTTAKKENPIRELMAKRAAQELRDGYYVNLGIGIPTLVANYIPKGMNVTLQSENGLLGIGPFPTEDEVAAGLSNARKQCTLPITGLGVVNLIITDLCVFEVKQGGGLVLIELHPGVTVDDIRAKTGAPFDVALKR